MQAVRPSKQRQRQQQSSKTSTELQLKGSTKVVSEFFEFSLSSILYQRGLYPPDDFKMVKKYGLNMMIPSDQGLRSYLTQITGQLAAWLNAKQVSRLVLAIMDKDSRETVERWQFDITLDENWLSETDGKENEAPGEAGPEASTSKPLPTEADIRAQIQALFKTICSSTAVLPLLNEACTFNVLAYTSSQISVPKSWSDSDPHLVMPKHPTAAAGTGVESIKLRSFGTGVHQVDGSVAYRLDS